MAVVLKGGEEPRKREGVARRAREDRHRRIARHPQQSAKTWLQREDIMERNGPSTGDSLPLGLDSCFIKCPFVLFNTDITATVDHRQVGVVASFT